MEVLVLGGGNSPEREVSLRSAKAVADAARQAGYEVDEADPADGFTIFDNLPKGIIVLPILHGQGGEDGTVQAELEKRGLAFLGSGSQVSSKCFDKWETLNVFKSAGVPIAESALVTKKNFKNHRLAAKPYVLKVVHNGSSIGVLIARNPSAVSQKQIDEIFAIETPAILEELIEGIEITVPVLDEEALPVIEIVPPVGKEFDYDNKYNGETAEICPPESVNKETQQKAQELALRCHKLMGCRHLSRIDIMIRPDNGMAVLDINTIPGLAAQSLYPKSAAVAGLPMPKLVQKFVELASKS